MRWVILSFAALLLLAFLSCLPLMLICAGCIPFGDGHTSVKGKVLDPGGQPIAGATVRLTEVDRGALPGVSSMTTEQNGLFSVGITHYPTTTKRFTFEVTKEGYITQKEEITGSASYEKEIVLRIKDN